MNQANFLHGYEVITMVIVLVTTKEKSYGTNFNQENWRIVFRLQSKIFKKDENIIKSYTVQHSKEGELCVGRKDIA